MQTQTPIPQAAIQAATQAVLPATTQPISRKDDFVGWLREHVRTTPGRMAVGMVASILSILLMALLGLTAYGNLHNAIQTVAKDSAPSIVAAMRIRAVLAEAHAEVLDAALTKEVDGGPNMLKYDASMKRAHEWILGAARNITFGDEEAKPILTLMSSVGEYEALIGAARAKGEAGTADLIKADELMKYNIEPAATKLADVNYVHLYTRFEQHKQTFRSLMTIFLIPVLLTIASLLGTQYYLSMRTRRTLNIGLLSAVVIMSATSLHALSTLNAVDRHLQDFKVNAFDSIHLLMKAKAVAYEANAAESFYLLLHGRPLDQAVEGQRFNNLSAVIVGMDADHALAATRAHKTVPGLLGSELGNVTYPGEEAAALRAINAWSGYVAVDQKIRQLEAAGKHAEAVALCLGTGMAQSDWWFEDVQSQLNNVLAINQNQFDNGTTAAFEQINRFLPLLLSAVAASIVAIYFGMRPRLNEYRF